MNDNVYKILELENNITDLVFQGKDLKDEEITLIVSEITKLLLKLNNQEILYLLANCSTLHNVLDVTDYLKKYKINKKKLKEENSYKEELRKLNNFVELIRESSFDENEYLYICKKCCIDDTADYLLSKMTNNDIMELSNESDDWNYKLFLYGNLKA